MKITSINKVRGVCLSFAASAVYALALQITAGAASMVVSSPVRASGGQCKWEGGLGGAMCKDEDCFEDGGNVFCEEPELRPPYPSGDGQTDGGKFQYMMCDVGPPSIPKIAAWCHAEGGTWVVTGASTQECQGLPPDYPGVGSATSEGAAIAAGNKFMNPPGATCSYSLSGDTGWALNETDNFCWGGGSITQNQTLLRAIRRQSFTAQPPCNGGGDIKYLKIRELQCPEATAYRIKQPSGDIQCFRPISSCATVQGNPVDTATGAKLQSENDYRAADGLEFTRYYNSLGRFRPRGSGSFAAGRSDYWRHTFARKLIPVAGSSYVIAYLQRDDGSLKAFNATGVEILNRTGAADKLQNLGAAGWKLTLANSDVENYDASGKITSVVTRAGVTTTLTYDATGRLSTIGNSFGRTLTLGYDGSGRLATLTIPAGSQIQYGYDSRQRPITVTYADLSAKTYHYENARNEWLLTGITDENSTRFATYNYNDQGAVVSEEHAGGADRKTFSAGDPKQSEMTATVVDARGTERRYSIARANGVFKTCRTTAFATDAGNPGNVTFDANGNYASTTDLSGRMTTFVYDQVRNLETSRTEGLTAFGAATSATRTITTQWHSTFRLPIEVSIYSGATAIGNPLTRTAFTHDAKGNVLTRTVTDPATTTARTWTFTYDSFGHVLTENGPRTDVTDLTTYTYNNCTTGNQCGLTATIKNALNQITTFNAYDAHGQATQVTDPNNVVTTMAYDIRRRLTDRCAGGALPACVGGELTHFDYWPTGLLKKITSPDSSFTLFTYDAAHRLTQIEDAAGNRVSYVLDAMGNRTSENVFDPYGTLLRTQQKLYSNLGQLWQILTVARTDSQATVLEYDSSGTQTAVNAPMYRKSTIGYDTLARIAQIVDPAYGTTAFVYNANNNMTSVTDPRNLTTTYGYSGLGDLLTQTSPDTGTTTNTFDSGGNLKTSTDARSAITTYTYDAINRVKSVAYKIGTATDQTNTYTYDAGTNGKGRLTSASGLSHTLAWTYDTKGRVLTETQSIGANSRVASYAYSNGKLASVTTPSGRIVTYVYTNGKVSSVSVDGATVLSNVLYEPFGPIGGWTWGNGTLAVRSYDLDGRLTLIDSAGLSIYTYHDSGAIAGRQDDVASSFSVPNGSSTLAVAAASNRVTSATGPLARSFTYDSAGNTLSSGPTVHTYYNSGRMKTGRLASTGTNTTYLYNVFGQRIRKTGGTPGTVVFFYDEAGHLLGEYGPTGALIQETVWLGDIPVATVRPNGTAFDIYYVHADHLNTPRRVTRPSNNTIVWRWDSDAFGEAPAKNDPDADGTSFVYNLRFPGQYYDVETRLHYNYFRDYDPAIGRYVESDPIGIRGGINLFTYAAANPITRFDEMGLMPNPAEGACVAGPNPVCIGGVVVDIIGWIIIGGLATADIRPGDSVAESRGKSDPIHGLKPFDPGRDCDGKCNACPPPVIWEAPGNDHGSTGGTHWHGIIWNQDPATCMCYPNRVSGPTKDKLK